METATLRDKVEAICKTVFDPEISVNIFDLGLVYKIDIKDNNEVHILMTLTAPGCPVGADIVFDLETKIRELEEVSDVHVQLTFDPPWSKDMMSEEAKLELGFY